MGLLTTASNDQGGSAIFWVGLPTGDAYYGTLKGVS